MRHGVICGLLLILCSQVFALGLGSSGQQDNNDLASVTGVLPAANGGTGVSNGGTITNASNTTITGGGTLALGGFTLTVPATGTAVLTSGAQSVAGVKSFTDTIAAKTGSAASLAYANTDATIGMSFEDSVLNFAIANTRYARLVNGNNSDGYRGWHLLNTCPVAWSTDTGGQEQSALRQTSPGVVGFEGSSSTVGATFSAIANSQAQFTANQDNLALTVKSLFQRWSSDAARDVTGIVAGVDGQTHVLVNVGAQNIVIKHQVTSTAANQFFCSTGADITLSANQAADAIYDSTTARWRVYKRN